MFVTLLPPPPFSAFSLLQREEDRDRLSFSNQYSGTVAAVVNRCADESCAPRSWELVNRKFVLPPDKSRSNQPDFDFIRIILRGGTING